MDLSTSGIAPVDLMDDAPDCAGRDAKVATQSGQWHTQTSAGADVTDLFFRHPCCPVSRAFGLVIDASAFGVHVMQVVGIGAQPEVLESTTRRVVTSVQNMEIGIAAVCERPGKSVRVPHLAIDGDLAIASLGACSSPDQAVAIRNKFRLQAPGWSAARVPRAGSTAIQSAAAFDFGGPALKRRPALSTGQFHRVGRVP